MKYVLVLIVHTLLFGAISAQDKKTTEKPAENSLEKDSLKKVDKEQDKDKNKDKDKEPTDNEDAYKRIDYALDWKYRGGEYFIYDCKREYYACVDSDGFERCTEDRKNSIIKGKKKYDCAPLKQFPDKRSCIVYNYSIIERVATRLFCYPK